MELKQLEHFVTVAREGGFARAARVLSLSQPSLTRSIAALEKGLDVRLFDRSSLGATINDAGNRLLPHAMAMLQEAERARAEFGSASRAAAMAKVRLGISPNMLFNRLPRLLREIVVGNQNAKVLVTTGTYESLCKSLRQRELDIVVCVSTGFPVERTPEDLNFQLFGTEQVVPVAPAKHAIFEAEVTLETANRHRWAIPMQMSLMHRFEYAFYNRNLPTPVHSLNSSSLSLMFDSVHDWGLLGMLPRSMFEHRAADNGMEILDIPELFLDYDINIFTNVSGELTEEAIALLSALDYESQRFRRVSRPGEISLAK